jgi:hypothetical protein
MLVSVREHEFLLGINAKEIKVLDKLK